MRVTAEQVDIALMWFDALDNETAACAILLFRLILATGRYDMSECMVKTYQAMTGDVR